MFIITYIMMHAFSFTVVSTESYQSVEKPDLIVAGQQMLSIRCLYKLNTSQLDEITWMKLSNVGISHVVYRYSVCNNSGDAYNELEGRGSVTLVPYHLLSPFDHLSENSSILVSYQADTQSFVYSNHHISDNPVPADNVYVGEAVLNIKDVEPLDFGLYTCTMKRLIRNNCETATSRKFSFNNFKVYKHAQAHVQTCTNRYKIRYLYYVKATPKTFVIFCSQLFHYTFICYLL